MKLPQRGQRPGSFHGSTQCFGSTGQAVAVLRQTSGAGTADDGLMELCAKITGGISGS